MINIKEIAEEIYSTDNTKTHKDLVQNIEKNLSLINTIDYNESEDIYDTYSQIIADYGLALAEIESYKKAIPEIEKALDLFKNNPKYTAENLKDVLFYEKLIFKVGVSNYYLDYFDKA